MVELQDGDALIVADVQVDFLPGGRLPVPHGEEVVAVLNVLTAVPMEMKGRG